MTAAATTATALSAAHVSKTFASQRALSDVSITIERGEIHGLVGPNGCGKSTFVKALAGYHEPDPGAVTPTDGLGGSALHRIRPGVGQPGSLRTIAAVRLSQPGTSWAWYRRSEGSIPSRNVR